MLILDLKNEFYRKIKGKSVLMLVNYDIDALCACKILQSLFQTDCMLYSIVPVDTVNDLQEAFTCRLNETKIVILINCGGTLDIVTALEPEDDVEFYVIDSHRPIDTANVYSIDQVKVIVRDTEREIPAYEDIYTDEENEEEEDEEIAEDSYLPDLERRRMDKSKRLERRHWEEQRRNIMTNYLKYSYYELASSLLLFELAWKMSQDNFDLLWYGIIGLTEQRIMNKITETLYSKECADLQSHASRLMHRNSRALEDRSVSITIEFKKQLDLALYRHWTVLDSLLYSVFTATKLKLWSIDGVRRLNEMLAEMGIPLSQCKQKFHSMESIYKNEFHESLLKMSEKYGLSNIEQISFTMKYGYRTKYAANDYVYALIGLLRVSGDDRSKPECFLDALEALSRNRKDRLEAGIQMAQLLLKEVFKRAQNCLDMGFIRREAKYLSLIIQENVHSVLFSHPYGIHLFADFILKAFVAKHIQSETKPLLISTPIHRSNEEKEGLCHITGIAKLTQDCNKTFFYKAFEKAAEICRVEILAKYIDASFIQIKLADRSKFFQTLDGILNLDE